MSTATVVRERPILFIAPMVKAILAGRKTQTRRVVKLSDPSATYAVHDDDGWPVSADHYGDWNRDPCPYGKPGDRLWVRETWWADWREPGVVIYDATPEFGKYQNEGEVVRSTFLDQKTLPTREESRAAMLPKFWKKRPSIFMPKWASRILLEITDVRVERLNSISEEDAIAEGAKSFPTGYVFEGTGMDKAKLCHGSASIAFACLWDEINGDGAWNANPWVWCLSFRRIEQESVSL